MDPISYEEYVRIAADQSQRNRFVAYSMVARGDGGFDFQVIPNPDLVEMSEHERELENAMQTGNAFERTRRRISFTIDRISNRDKPVLVSEGDSWFQFPLLIDEVIDHLSSDYAILSLGAAGDTAANMTGTDFGPGKNEYLGALRQHRRSVRAFLFSAAGNDLIGEDPETKVPALRDIIRPYNGDPTDIAGHINDAEVDKRLDRLRSAYEKVIGSVRAEPGLERLPILIHGYDYVFPYPARHSDPRRPIYAKRDQWLGSAFTFREFPASTQQELTLRRDLVKNLIDRLYVMMGELAGDSAQSGVWLVDNRGAMPDLGDWNDEIHGTSAGFAKVAARFRTTLNSALAAV